MWRLFLPDYLNSIARSENHSRLISIDIIWWRKNIVQTEFKRHLTIVQTAKIRVALAFLAKIADIRRT
ncbi:MAG: hypothetical protein K6E73_09700 [Bacteroidales bacterium]|nr:hypothetical protein [Bacteroidales bacterium]